MLKVQRNDKAFKELEDYAKTVGQPVKDVLLSDDHLKQVSDIFYPHMPKMVRLVMKKDKFTEFYRNHREEMVATMGI